MSEVIGAIRRLLSQNDLLRPDAALLCAVSGGADSMALLWGLCRIREEVPFRLKAVHVQHGLRGEESLADEAFVRSFCESRSVPLTVRDAGLRGSMEDPGMETRARDSRRRIFREEAEGMDALLLAHHRDDQAETVLMHLLRGAGAEGLSGMKPVQNMGGVLLLRPFLTLPKQSLLQALEEAGIPHREDSSNREAVTPRNCLRLEILPQMEKLFPGAASRIADNTEILNGENAYLQQQAMQLYGQAVLKAPGLFALRREPLEGCPEVLLRRLLRHWLREAFEMSGHTGGELGLSHAETLALLVLARNGESSFLNLPHKLRAERGRFLLSLTRQNGEPLIPCDGEMPLSVFGHEGDFASFGTFFHREAADGSLPKDPETIILPPCFEQAVLRRPQPGDRIRPLGAPGGKPYRRFLTDIRMDTALRPLWPVLALGEEVLWVPGLCTAEALRAGEPEQGSIKIGLSEGLIPYILHQKEK